MSGCQQEGISLHELHSRGSAINSALLAIPTTKLPASCRASLLKLVRGELNFVQVLGTGAEVVPSSNFGHFEAVVQLLQHPLVTGICGVNQKFSVSSSPGGDTTATAHVDLVGLYDGKPAWFVVSDRNPKYNVWERGLESRTALLLQAALADVVVRPSCIVFFFAKGVEAEVENGFEEELNAHKVEVDDGSVESGEWLLVGGEGGEMSLSSSWISVGNRKPVMYRIDVAPSSMCFEAEAINVSVCKGIGKGFVNIVLRQECSGGPDGLFYAVLEEVSRRWVSGDEDTPRLVNLDTTALIGMVSGISNNMASTLASWSPAELEKKFSSFGHFFRTQSLLELEEPFLPEVADIFKEKQPMISQFAWDEFESIVSVVGGPEEKRRAKALHACFKPFIIPNNPSERVLALPQTGKIQDKHKTVFGTGDRLEAPTLTSNVSFIRAAISKGMALAFIEHRPLALTRD